MTVRRWGKTQIPDDRSRLLTAARALLAARATPNFPSRRFAPKPGGARCLSRAFFSGKAALLAALMAPAPPADIADPPADPPSDPPSDPKAAQEPAVPAPDAWLERRLRVFERALNALEEKAETRAREQDRALAHAGGKNGQGRGRVRRRLRPSRCFNARTAPPPRRQSSEPMRPRHRSRKRCRSRNCWSSRRCPSPPFPGPKWPMCCRTPAMRRAPPPPVPDGACAQRQPPGGCAGLRSAALSLVALFLCVGLTLGNTARATAQEGDGVCLSPCGEGRPGAHHRTQPMPATRARRPGWRWPICAERVCASDSAAAVRWSASGRQGRPAGGQNICWARCMARAIGVKPDPARPLPGLPPPPPGAISRRCTTWPSPMPRGWARARTRPRRRTGSRQAAMRGYVDSAFRPGGAV